MTSEEGKGDVVLERIWTEIQQGKVNGHSEGDGDDNNNDNTTSTTPLSNHLESGYTTDEASQMRELVHNDAFNVVPPPVDCPAWLCIVLPCINHLQSMKAHKNCTPDDAEVLRNGKWIRYDAASLVVGDVIRLEEGDIVPADCVIAVPIIDDEDDLLLVDLRVVTGQSRPKQFNNNSSSNNNDNNNNNNTRNERTLLLGGTVVQGRAKALVTAIGTETVLGQLIKTGKFPVPEKEGDDDDEESVMMNEDTTMTTMEMGTMS